MDFYSANLILFSTAMGFSIIASYFDLKTGEIPDKFTIGLVVVALIMRLGFSAMMGDFNYFLDGLIVGLIFFAFGAALFYTGAWGGGDAKLLAGIGASLGGSMMPSLLDSAINIFPSFFGFFIAMSMVAIPYSLIYAFILAFKSPKAFSLMKERVIKNSFILALACIASLTLFILLKPYNALLMFVILSPPVFFLLMIFTRSVEEVAMQKDVALKDLHVGDMVVEDLMINGKKVASKRDMDGFSKEVLEKIQKSKKAPKTVRIKWGIKFAPAFPLAMLVAPVWMTFLFFFL
jgi:Flp pilus assembly protein protease CpaA